MHRLRRHFDLQLSNKLIELANAQSKCLNLLTFVFKTSYWMSYFRRQNHWLMCQCNEVHKKSISTNKNWWHQENVNAASSQQNHRLVDIHVLVAHLSCEMSNRSLTTISSVINHWREQLPWTLIVIKINENNHIVSSRRKRAQNDEAHYQFGTFIRKKIWRMKANKTIDEEGKMFIPFSFETKK